MQRLNRIVVDSSQSVSDLCVLGSDFITDKSPYNSGINRHPYTAVYDLLFACRRYEHLTFAEIGIAYNASMLMWRSYFPNADLYGFDFSADLLDRARKSALAKTHYAQMDVSDPASVFAALNATQRSFDILIDDSTHLFEHLVSVVPITLKFVKPGGMIILEDIFRPWPESRFEEALRPVFKYFSSGTFIETNHANRSSSGDEEPYYDNDKLLVLHRNQEPAPFADVEKAPPSPLLVEALSRGST